MSAATDRVFPAEWGPHAASWFSWPANPDTWTDALEATRKALAEGFLAIAAGEPVLVNVGSAEEAEQVHDLTGGHPQVRCLHLPSNDSWCRDHGPTFVFAGGRPRVVTWNYNAWGGKYPPYDLDNVIGSKMAARVGVPVDRSIQTLEGGGDQWTGYPAHDGLLHPESQPQPGTYPCGGGGRAAQAIGPRTHRLVRRRT